jgi:hypothetical protein
LGKVADPQALAGRNGSAVLLLDPREDLEQGGFTRAVGTDQARALTLEETEGKVLKEGTVTEGLGEVLTAQQDAHAMVLGKEMKGPP